MDSNAMVSIICLCYNHEKYVIESLDSVINQTYQNIEIIIVDDCSTDASVDKITEWTSKHTNTTFIANPKNLGNTKSFNKALSIAKGEYIIDLATDDVLLPDCVQKQLNCFNNSNFTNLGIVYGNAELISDTGSSQGYYFSVDDNQKATVEIPSGDVYAKLLEKWWLKNSVSSLIKREVFEKLGGYDETLAYEDFDFWTRASRIYNVEYTDEILVQKRVLPKSLSSSFSGYFNKINYSTYVVLKKAYKLNNSKEEDTALNKRVLQEIKLTLKNFNLMLAFKLVVLRMKLLVR